MLTEHQINAFPDVVCDGFIRPLSQDLQGLIDVIVTNRDLHVSFYLIILSHTGHKAHC